MAKIEKAASAQTSPVLFYADLTNVDSEDGANLILRDGQDRWVIAKLTKLTGADAISSANKKLTRELSKEQLPLGKKQNLDSKLAEIEAKEAESDSGTSVGVYLLIVFLVITIVASLIVLVVFLKKK